MRGGRPPGGGRTASEIFGSPDDLKLRSCATLFALVLPPGPVFDQILNQYYGGERDGRTLALPARPGIPSGAAGRNTMNVRHRIITIASLGLLWMLGGAAIGASLAIIVGIVDPPSIGAGEGPIDLARILGGVGAASGIVFGVLLLIGERRREVADVPLMRALMWGAVTGLLLPVLSISDAHVSNRIVLGVVGAVVSVALARMARRRLPAAA